MQDEDARRRRLVEARRAAVIRERDRCAAGVRDLVVDREHVVFIDRDRAAEGQAAIVRIGQRHRRISRQLAVALRRPDRLRPGNSAGFGRSDIADLGKEAARKLGRIEKFDVWRVLLDGDTVVLEPQIIKAGAREVDRAAEARRVDRDASAVARQLVARSRLRGAALRRCARDGRARNGGAWSESGPVHRLLYGLLRRLLLLNLGSLSLDARVHVEHLPQRQDQNGQRDRDEEIAVVFHSGPCGALSRRVRSFSTARAGARRTAPPRRHVAPR